MPMSTTIIRILALPLLTGLVLATARAERPNLIVIMVDDMGYPGSQLFWQSILPYSGD